MLQDLYEEIDPQQLTGYARAALEADQGTQALRAWLPDRQVPDITFAVNQVTSATVSVAEYRAPNVEGVIADGSFGETVLTGQIPAMTEVGIMKEFDIIRTRANPGAELINQAMTDVGDRVRACSRRINLARGETLENGSVVLAEGGLATTIDWGRSAGHSTTAGTLWSNIAALALSDLYDIVDTYNNTNGYMPGAIVVPRAVVNAFRQCTEVLEATGAVSARASRESVDVLLANEDLPPFIINDELYTTSTGNRRVISANICLLLPPAGVSIGNTVHGVSAEAQALGLGVAEQPGIVADSWTTRNPVSIATMATAWTVPVLGTPDATFRFECLA
jgi:hypothetical protein